MPRGTSQRSVLVSEAPALPIVWTARGSCTVTEESSGNPRPLGRNAIVWSSSVRHVPGLSTDGSFAPSTFLTGLENVSFSCCAGDSSPPGCGETSACG